jgi:hypothetical protein
MSQENYKNKYLRYKSKYLNLKYGGEHGDENDIFLKKQRIENFIRVLFASIGRPPSLCFFVGTLVLQDNDDSLYNLLRYGEDTNNQSNNSSYIDLNQRHLTSDYMEVFKRNTRVKMEFYNSNQDHEQVLCNKNQCLKFELVFNKPLENLCERHKANKTHNLKPPYYVHEIEEMYKQPKESILFYKFVYNNNKYIFLKLLPTNYEQMRQMQQMQQMQETEEFEGGSSNNKKKKQKNADLQEKLKKLEQERQVREQREEQLLKQLEEEIQKQQQREEEIKPQLDMIKEQERIKKRQEDIKEQDKRRIEGRKYEQILKEKEKKDEEDKQKMSKFYIRDETDLPEYMENKNYFLRIKDNWFYHHLYGNTNDKKEMDKINYYNDHLRTGNEFFIPEKLKNEIINFSKSDELTKKYVSFYNEYKISEKDLDNISLFGLQTNMNLEWYPRNEEDDKKNKGNFWPFKKN